MPLLLGHDETVARWVGARVEASFFPPHTAIGILSDEGFMVGGIVFHDWNDANLELTVVLLRPFRRGEVRGLADYVFRQLGARRVTFRTLVGNAAARRFLDRHATFEAELPGWFPAGDAVQYRIMSDDPRWSRWSMDQASRQVSPRLMSDTEPK